jgi:hypothetical protein
VPFDGRAAGWGGKAEVQVVSSVNHAVTIPC